MQKAFRGVNWPLFSGFYHNFGRSNSVQSCGIFESILCGSLIELMPLFASKPGQNCASFWRGYEQYRYIFLTLRSVKMTLEEGINFAWIMWWSWFKYGRELHIFCCNIVVMLKQKSYGYCTNIEAISVQYFDARSRKTLRDFQLNLRNSWRKNCRKLWGFLAPELAQFWRKGWCKIKFGFTKWA